MRISLDGTWRLTYAPSRMRSPGVVVEPTAPPAAGEGGRKTECRVPGNVELDLERAGVLPTLFRGENVIRLREYETYEWWYEREFDSPDLPTDRRALLRFCGVDCVATYWLNDVRIGESANALIEHTFDITEHLRQGDPNLLRVRIESPIVAASRSQYDPVVKAQPVNWDRLRIRKAAHTYGWDIMPRAMGSGLWRSVELEVQEPNEITQLYFITEHTGYAGADGGAGAARVSLFFTVRTDAANLGNAELRLHGTCGESSFDVMHPVLFCAGRLYFDVEDPHLWWPCGYGDPNLYEVRAELIADGRVVASRETTLGIRTIDLDRTEATNARGEGEFLFRVNGTPIMVKGSNWTPADAFHSRDPQRYPGLFELVRDLGCNMLRCWGGGVYEDEAFFDFCDRTGVLVWQDFAMACARYPQDEAFLSAVRVEAEAVVARIRRHPSLAVWCGDNECDEDWPDPSKNRLTREVIPQVIDRLDPGRPYVPSSPYWSPESVARAPRPRGALRRDDHDLLPERHLWGPRDYFKSDMYTQHKAHFVGEIGYSGVPNVSSIRRFIDDDHLWPPFDDRQWFVHATDPLAGKGPWAYRIDLLRRQITELFGTSPDNLQDFARASQISQAEAKKFFVEMTRLGKWRRTGVLWWNVADGWPQFSDSLVDYYFGKKLAYSYVRRVQRPVCVMIDELKNWYHRVVVGNDSREDVRGTYRIWDAESDATVLEGAFLAPANQNVDLGTIRGAHSERRLLLIEWRTDTATGGNHYVAGAPPLDYSRYLAWLPAIASLSDGFDPAGVAG